jgi:hypothetical protein
LSNDARRTAPPPAEEFRLLVKRQNQLMFFARRSCGGVTTGMLVPSIKTIASVNLLMI